MQSRTYHREGKTHQEMSGVRTGLKYMGSKASHAKEILPIILYNRTKEQIYIEPFCGGCNVIDKVDGLRIANDYNEYLISMWEAIVQGWNPPSYITNEEYDDIKNNKEKYDKKIVGFVGFNTSYGGKFWGGYSRGNNNGGEPRNYTDEGRRNIMKQVDSLRGVNFTNHSYLDMVIPKGSIVYCDPPYKGTTGYKNSIDHAQFWEWVRKISKDNKVFVSEYNAPDDFICLWEKKVKCDLTKNNTERNEKLFIHKESI